MSLPYNSDPNGQDICTFADKLVHTDSNSFPVSEKTLYANQAMSIIWSAIFKAYGGWHWDDSNQTDLPEATCDINQGQQIYVLPVDSASLIGVEFKNQGGVWVPMYPLTMERIRDNGIAESQFLNVNAMPVFYRPVANAIKIYPPANYSQTASLKVYFSRSYVSFTAADTTKTPGFDAEFHDGLPIYIAFQYAKNNQLKLKPDLQADWQAFIARLSSHFSERFRQLFPPRMTAKDATLEFM